MKYPLLPYELADFDHPAEPAARKPLDYVPDYRSADFYAKSDFINYLRAGHARTNGNSLERRARNFRFIGPVLHSKFRFRTSGETALVLLVPGLLWLGRHHDQNWPDYTPLDRILAENRVPDYQRLQLIAPRSHEADALDPLRADINGTLRAFERDGEERELTAPAGLFAAVNFNEVAGLRHLEQIEGWPQ